MVEHMKKEQMPLNEFVFNSLIFGYTKIGNLEQSHKLFSVHQLPLFESGQEEERRGCRCWRI